MKKLCVNLVIYKDNTRMHGQQNIKENTCYIYYKQESLFLFLEKEILFAVAITRNT